MQKIKGKYKIIALPAIVIAICFALWLKINHTVRYAVFAGYNADETLHPYVISYLKALNEVTDGVVYIADSKLKPEEEEKLKPLTIHYENKRHEEHDFGSYKRGYNWLKENGYLKKADELIFANDSTYLLTDLKPMFDEMAKRKELDFWGDLQNTFMGTHIQSYFMVFRKKVINSKSFAIFLNKVHHFDHFSLYITQYEIRLTPMLAALGYKWDSYMPYHEMDYLKEETDKNSYPLTLISKYHHPFLKRRTFTSLLKIFEDRTELLRYIRDNYPARYEEIKQEINPQFLPKD